MMNFVNYKKMCAKKLAAKKVSKVRKVRKVSKVRKVRKGGSSCSQLQNGGNEDQEMESEFVQEKNEGLLGGGRRNLNRSRSQKQKKQQQQQQQQQQQKQLRNKRSLSKRKRGGYNSPFDLTGKETFQEGQAYTQQPSLNINN
jgi:hypothetical protein